jgi:hypothetical protein
LLYVEAIEDFDLLLSVPPEKDENGIRGEGPKNLDFFGPLNGTSVIYRKEFIFFDKKIKGDFKKNLPRLFFRTT